MPDLRMIQTVVRNAGMILVGIRADAADYISEAQKVGLPVFPPAKTGEPRKPQMVLRTKRHASAPGTGKEA